MFGKFSYIVLLTVVALIPLVFVLIKYRKVIMKYKKILLVLFLAWFTTSMIIDQYARLDGFWFNPEETNSGIYLFAIPLEDVIASAAIGLWLPIFTILLSLKEEKGELKFKRL